jgi:hypothetical protein
VLLGGGMQWGGWLRVNMVQCLGLVRPNFGAVEARSEPERVSSVSGSSCTLGHTFCVGTPIRDVCMSLFHYLGAQVIRSTTLLHMRKYTERQTVLVLLSSDSIVKNPLFALVDLSSSLTDGPPKLLNFLDCQPVPSCSGQVRSSPQSRPTSRAPG